MNILQAGVPKSGNYWLYSIIKNILEQAGEPHRSYIQQHPIQSHTANWQLSFAGQARMDFLTIKNQRCYCRISEVFKEEIDDIDSYIQQCSQVWTHSLATAPAVAIMSKFDKIVYIIRDPRDVALSYAKFAFTEHKLKNGSPHYETNPQTYLENRLEEMTRRWVQHVGSYLRYQTQLNIYPVFYESFLHSFDRELEKLLAYLEIELSAAAIAKIKHQVTFKTMKQQSPKHLRKGSSGQWQDKLSDRQKQTVEEVAAPMLKLLNYPVATSEGLPKIPDKIDLEVLERAVTISHRSPFDQVKRFYDFVYSQRSIDAKLNLARVWSSGRIKRFTSGA